VAVTLDASIKPIRTCYEDGPELITAVPRNDEGLSLRLASGEKNPIQGWVSHEYGHKEPSATLIQMKDRENNAGFTTVLYPVPASGNNSILVTQLFSDEEANQIIEIKLNRNKTDYYIKGNVNKKINDNLVIKSRCNFFLVRTIQDLIKEIFIYERTALTFNSFIFDTERPITGVVSILDNERIDCEGINRDDFCFRFADDFRAGNEEV
jgi:hypothetical protein